MYWTVHLEGGPRRVNHAAVAVGQKIYSFGGFCNGENYQIPRPIDVHVLNTVSLRWSFLPTSSYNGFPFQRYGHAVVSYGENIYLWGGRNDECACNVLYCFDTVTHRWHRPPVSGYVPGARDGHSACIVDDKIYIFGGYEENIDRFSQDVFSFDLKTMTWTFVYTTGTPPRWRDFHSATPAAGHRMYIFGGRGDRQGPIHSQDEIYCNKIIYLDTETMRWVHPETKGNPPIGRRSHSAFVYNGQLYIIGGYNGLINRHFKDLHRFNPETNTWSLVKVKGHGPCSRRRQCCCLLGDKLYFFGGTSPSRNHTPLVTMPDILDINGSNNLMDHADLHVLDFFPTLKTLCTILVIEKRLDTSSLPKDIRWEIAAMTTNNSITRPLQNNG